MNIPFHPAPSSRSGTPPLLAPRPRTLRALCVSAFSCSSFFSCRSSRTVGSVPAPFENQLRELKSLPKICVRSRCSPSVQKRAKTEQTTLLFSETYKHAISQVFSIHRLTFARGYVFLGRFSLLPFNQVTTIPFRMRSFKTQDLKPFRMFSCEKTPNREPAASISPKHFLFFPHRVNMQHAGTPATRLLSCVYFITRGHPGGGGTPLQSINSRSLRNDR